MTVGPDAFRSKSEVKNINRFIETKRTECLNAIINEEPANTSLRNKRDWTGFTRSSIIVYASLTLEN